MIAKRKGNCCNKCYVSFSEDKKPAEVWTSAGFRNSQKDSEALGGQDRYDAGSRLGLLGKGDGQEPVTELRLDLLDIDIVGQ